MVQEITVQRKQSFLGKFALVRAQAMPLPRAMLLQAHATGPLGDCAALIPCRAAAWVAPDNTGLLLTDSDDSVWRLDIALRTLNSRPQKALSATVREWP